MKIKSLHHNLVITVSSVMLLLSLIATGAAYLYEFRHSQIETEVTLNQLLDTVSRTASIAAYSKNKQIAKDVLDGLLNNSVVQQVYISSHEGFSLEQGKEDLPIGISVFRELISPFDEHEVIGAIYLSTSVQYSLEKAKQSAIFSIIFSISLISITTLLILWQVRRRISAPLALLSDTLHAIKNTDEKRIPLLVQHEHDELGRLRHDINELLDTLEIQFNTEHTLREQVENTEQRLRHIYNSSSAGLFLLDEHGKLLNYNSTLVSILNSSEQLDGKAVSPEDIFKSLLSHQKNFILLVKNALNSGNLESQDLPLAGTDTRSSPCWVHCLLSKIIDSKGHAILEGVLFDVTERIHNEEAIKHEAYHDTLTGMLRRHPAKTQFEAYIANNSPANASFLLMDLDGFKQINDTYGHLAGDKVLSIVAERLFQCVRASDIVCRLGGDEFLIILVNSCDGDLKFHVADKILKSIQQPISLNASTIVTVGISIGITNLELSHSVDFDRLVKDADEAMYKVKNSGKNNFLIKGRVDEQG